MSRLRWTVGRADILNNVPKVLLSCIVFGINIISGQEEVFRMQEWLISELKYLYCINFALRNSYTLY